MSRSFTFDSVDMDDYGLVVTRHQLPFAQEAVAVQLHDLTYAFDSYRPSLFLSMNVAVEATSFDNLKTALDNIKKVLNLRSDANLTLDIWDDRYWRARFRSMRGDYRSPLLWNGAIDFVCHDPMAFDNSQVSNNYNIDADPKTIVETPGGTGLVSPVYTLTAGEVIAPGDIKIKNDTAGEEFIWNTGMGNAEVLIIDVDRWYVTLEGAAAMDGVSGKFPRLLPGEANDITVTGFGSLGALNITYRNRYI